MANRKKGSVIGFDPLAWMKDGHESRVAGPGAGIPGPVPEAREETGVVEVARDTPRATPGPIVTLDETLTIEQVGALHAELGRQLGCAQVVLDAGALQRIDAAGLQLLAAFVRTAAGRGAQIEWRSPTAALRDAARRTGLAPALRLA